MDVNLIAPTFLSGLQAIRPRERHPPIIGRFDALAAGQALHGQLRSSFGAP